MHGRIAKIIMKCEKKELTAKAYVQVVIVVDVF